MCPLCKASYLSQSNIGNPPKTILIKNTKINFQKKPQNSKKDDAEYEIQDSHVQILGIQYNFSISKSKSLANHCPLFERCHYAHGITNLRSPLDVPTKKNSNQNLAIARDRAQCAQPQTAIPVQPRQFGAPKFQNHQMSVF
jgi:hypothetical protein